MQLVNLATPFYGGRTLYWDVAGSSWSGINYTTDPYATSSPQITATGLAPNTTYQIWLDAYRTSDFTFLASFYSSATTSGLSRPPNWSWTTSELNAFNNNGAVSTLTYTRWNAFVDRVNEFRQYKSLPVVSGAHMISDIRSLSAYKFNLVKNGVDQMAATGISDRSDGQSVFGSYFTTLSTILNSIS